MEYYYYYQLHTLHPMSTRNLKLLYSIHIMANQYVSSISSNSCSSRIIVWTLQDIMANHYTSSSSVYYSSIDTYTSSRPQYYGKPMF